MKLYIILGLFVIFPTITIYAQDKCIDFFEKEFLTKEEASLNERVVLFKLVNIENEKIQDEINRIMNNDSKIKMFKVKDMGSCYAQIDNTVTPIDIRNKVIGLGIDLDILSFKVYDIKCLYPDLPDGFPVYTDTGDIQYDKKVYDQSVRDWFNDNPEVEQLID